MYRNSAQNRNERKHEQDGRSERKHERKYERERAIGYEETVHPMKKGHEIRKKDVESDNDS